ncbi:ChrR family anti-sigma-E factor [Nioella nitratireducens]|uniref:ChrR family anti-sigma-E factor n=1 Tax=Nioella nitratireducens TaxID=1287720 RepID=UPI0008FD8902|nr:ChrR family anti-sigma-E factor [Nioella nitratireducens]
MSKIHHHIPEPMLAAYAAGTLPHVFEVVVATHISLCAQCRAGLEAHETAGGVVLEATNAAALSDDLKADVLALLDIDMPEPPAPKGSGIFPAPVMAALKNRPPRWKSLGFGVRQSILEHGSEGSLRLLHIPPGRAVPDHGHNGIEMTLVLQGSFADETGAFGVGDLEVAGDELEHTPIAGEGEPCICLAATDAPLRFTTMIPRLLQPLFRI